MESLSWEILSNSFSESCSSSTSQTSLIWQAVS